MKLVPRLSTASGYQTDESVTSLAAMAYIKQKWPKWTFKAEGVYSGNLHHLTMLGGYAVRDDIIPAGPVPDAWAYAPTDVPSL